MKSTYGMASQISAERQDQHQKGSSRRAEYSAFQVHTRKRLAIIWTHFGPYHLARIRALDPHFDVKAIELASNQRLYRWGRSEPVDSVTTLYAGDSEDQNTILVAIRLWREMTLLRPEVILVPGYASVPALCAAVWGQVHGAKTVLMSESNFDDRRRSRLGEAVKRILIAHLFDCGIVGGERAASYLQRLGMREDKIARKYDVVDNEYFASRVAKCRLEADTPEFGRESEYFLFVGRLAPEKNISTLLDAFGEYRASGGTWKLVIVGDGPLNGALRSQADAHILSGDVVFAGQKSVRELPSLYAFAGCFVLPSISEPWGLVVNEAMASGLPVIVSSRCGCVDDLVEDGRNGFVVESGSVPSIATAFTRMSTMSSVERASMAKRSEEIIANYSPEYWAKEISWLVSSVGRENPA